MATSETRPSRAVVLEDNLDLNEPDRARLEAVLERSLEQARLGDTMSAEDTFAWLRSRREAAKHPRCRRVIAELRARSAQRAAG